MGVQQAVRLAEKPVPAWLAVSDWLAQRGFPVQTRMIDGQLAFPDETPPDDWSELRVGTPLGMVTLRREPEQVVFVTWGNADEPLRQAWHALTWAFAALGHGTVLTDDGPLTAAEFQRMADLPAVLRTAAEP